MAKLPAVALLLLFACAHSTGVPGPTGSSTAEAIAPPVPADGRIRSSLDKSRGGFDRFRWGMTVAEVQGAYPGGHARREQNGEIKYWVVRRVAGLSTALSAFTFDEGGLLSVSTLFPEQGSFIDLDSGAFNVADLSKSKEIEDILFSSLVSKYGPPNDHLNDGGTWLLPEGKITLMILPDGHPAKATAGLIYSRQEQMGEDGL